MKISEIQAKDKKPFRAYFNRVPIWWKYHERTQAIFDYANERYYQLPTNKLTYDDYIRGVVKEGLFDKLDLHYIFSGDGDINFRLINIINPGTYNGTAFGGLEWSNEGVKGNGINGYINTNFNPALLVEGQKFQPIDASFGGVIYRQPSTGNVLRNLMSTGLNTNFIIASNTVQNRINSITNLEATLVFAGTGMTLLSRENNLTILCIKKDQLQERDQPVWNMSSNNFTVLRLSETQFSDQTVSTIAIGASLTYEEVQLERQFFNEYLTAIGLEPIA